MCSFMNRWLMILFILMSSPFINLNILAVNLTSGYIISLVPSIFVSSYSLENRLSNSAKKKMTNSFAVSYC